MKTVTIKIIFIGILLILLPSSSILSVSWKNDDQTLILLEAMERLTPDRNLTSPPLTFTIQSNLSQTDMILGSDDKVVFNDIKIWQIQILNRNGKKVSFIQGKQIPPSTIFWSGFSTNGEILPDGFYDAQFIWQDLRGKIHKTPKISFCLFTPLEIKNLSNLKLKFDYTPDGLMISIPDIMMFEPGQFEIRTGILPALNKVSGFLKSYPRNRIIIKGHTDSSGSVKKNISLSYKRAFCVYQYFINNGIEPERLTYQGMGSNQPITTNITKEGRAKNRRVEIVVLKTTI